MQVKGNVNTANLLLVGNMTGNIPVKTEADNSAGDFASLLTNVQNSAGSKAKPSEQMSFQEKKQPIEKSAVQRDKKESDAVERQPAEQADTKLSAETSSVDKTVESVSEETTDLTEEEIEAVMGNISSLVQIVMEQFQLTNAELSDKLTEFGMDLADLTTKEGLKAFFLNMNSAEVSDLIIDEDLNLKLQSVLGELEDVLQALDALETDISSFLEGEIEEMVIPEISDMSNREEIPEGSQNLSEQILQDEPKVVVTNETETSQDGEASQKQQLEHSSTSLNLQDGENTERVNREKQNTFENPILQAIQDAVDQVEDVATVDSRPVNGAEIIEQIVEEVRVHMNQNTTSLEMQLYPEHLGKIQINVISKDGIMTARIVAESEAAKQAIENGLTNLKETMQQQDLKVEAIEVMVSTTGFERNNEEKDSAAKNQTTKGHRKLDLSELEEESVTEDTVEVEKMRATGSSVSYMA